MSTFSKKLGPVALAVALTVGSATVTLANETTSSIRGNVASETGATFSSATVTITHTPSGTVSRTTTNESGAFSARSLRVGGPYTIEISGDGFQAVKIENVFLSLDQTFSLPVTVQAVSDSNVLTITGNRQGLQSFSNEGLSTSLGLQALQEVTSIDRDITDAALLDPFASVNFQDGGAKELTIAGANNRFNSLTIDGVALNDRFGLNANGYPTQRSPISFDAIESLSIQTAPFDVEYNGFTGGTINAVTKSGTNEFKGSVAYYYTDDSNIGDKSGDDEFSFTFEEETFVATLGGPIIEDKLFFFVAYDKYEEVAPLNDGPVGSGALNIQDGITQADVDQVRQIVQNVWGFDIGGFAKPPAEDEKILANIDWNINEDHRAKFTYISTDGNTIREQNGNNFTTPFGTDPLGASSTWYNRSETVESFIGHVFSDWTPDFSTEFKIASTEQATGQNSLNGAEFPLIGVDVGGGNILNFGPDRFRHGNELDQEFFQIKFVGEYAMGDHLIKFGYEREDVDVNNLFAQNAEGSYYVASIADLQNAIATEFSYQNAVTNDENDLRAIWGYTFNSLYIQDSWDVNGDLIIDFGLRYDWYGSDGSIRENQNFINRYGFTNTTDLSDESLLLPRISFKWTLDDATTLRGGLGGFSGGSPGVWISNSYSNDGVIQDDVSIDGPLAIPTSPDPTTGQYVPQQALNDLATLQPDGSVNALSPKFDIPVTYKLNLGIAHETDLGFLGNDWTLSADMLYNRLEDASYWYDARCRAGIEKSPDGRNLYNCSGPEAIVVGSASSNSGSSNLWAVSAAKEWNTEHAGNFDLFVSYTNADVKDIGYGTSSTATSNYSDFAAFDRQQPVVGTSRYEIEHLMKLRFNWRKEFVPGYETKVSIFGTRRPGQTYSYTFAENNNCILDVGGGRCRRESRNDDAGHLLYVPTGPADPLFSAASFGGDLAERDAFFNYIANSDLRKYQGSIAPRNGDTSPWYTIFDVRFQQELPAFADGHKFRIFIDIENFGNLINDDWGRIELTEYEYERDVVAARINNGQYEYFNLNSEGSINNFEIRPQSVWQLQVGFKYDF